MSTCYHCGLPVVETAPMQLEVLGKTRNFCCPGCHAVCKTIVDQGLSDYYKNRDSTAKQAEAQPDFLAQLKLYDRPEIQRSFVQQEADIAEAALMLEDIRCPACLWLNEQQLRQHTGVVDVELDYTSHRATVRWDTQATQLSDILAAIAAIGYRAHPYDPQQHAHLLRNQQQRSGERLLFAGLLMMPVMHFAIASYILVPPEGEALPLWMLIGRWSSFILSIALLLYPGQDFFLGAWHDLKNRRLGMDVPIVLGLLAALVGSFISTVQQSGEVYYDAIAMFVFFLLMARYLEMRGRRKAVARLDYLARVLPQSAERQNADGQWETVPTIDLQRGDKVRVKAGDTVPMDGVLCEGSSSFNEAVLTGEARPVLRNVGDTVIAGAVNGEHPVIVEVSHDNRSSTLNRIQQLVQEGLRSKPNYAILAERAAHLFVAAVLIIASLSAGIWWWIDASQALPNTIAILIVTCPCALALATPVALTVSAGRFVEAGILPLRMEALENLANADYAVFDKTGSLTLGQAEVAESHYENDAAKTHAFALSSASEHIFAQAVSQHCRDVACYVSTGPQQIRNHPGKGISAQLGEDTWRFGSLPFIQTHTDLSPQQQQRCDTWQAKGYSLVLLANKQHVQAMFALHDPIRDGAEHLIQNLAIPQQAILSGDHAQAVAHVADKVQIQPSHSSLRPEDKLAWIQARQAEGCKVLMLGDGLNDAPTLAAADVSLSFSSATALAQTHSDFLLLNDSLDSVSLARRLALHTRKIIRQNLFWAASYNALMIPAAALGLMPPWGAAIGMSLSSLLVVANSLRAAPHLSQS